MDDKEKSSPNPPEPSHEDDLQISEAAPPSYSASYSQPDEMTPSDAIAPSPRSAPLADAEPKADGTKSTMGYTQPPEPQRQQNTDYKTPFGPSRVPIRCPVCRQRTLSKTKRVSGGYTYGWALGVCAVTGLGCIPFCIGRLKNVEHRCENCDEKLATWHRYDGRIDRHVWS